APHARSVGGAGDRPQRRPTREASGGGPPRTGGPPPSNIRLRTGLCRRTRPGDEANGQARCGELAERVAGRVEELDLPTANDGDGPAVGRPRRTVGVRDQEARPWAGEADQVHVVDRRALQLRERDRLRVWGPARLEDAGIRG